MISAILQSDVSPQEAFGDGLLMMVTLMASLMIIALVMRLTMDADARKAIKRYVRGAIAGRVLTGSGGSPVRTILLIAGIIGVGYFFRPWLHWLAYFVWTTPLLWAAAGTVILATIYTAARYDPDRAATVASGLSIGVLVLLVIGLVFAGWAASVELNDQTMQRSTAADGLMETSSEQPRVVPRAVANRFASNTLNLPRYRLAESDITMVNGTPHWSYPLAPDGFRNYLIEDQDGTVFVDMTEQNIRVNTTRGQLQEGVGTVVWNRYKWHLLKHGQYLVDYQDPFMVVRDDRQYIAVPYIKPQFHLWYTTPEWGGVALIHEDGTVEDLSPAEARQHPVLEGQRLYPFDLAYKEVKKTKYRRGVVNQLPVIGSHRDEIEIAPVPGSSNNQPFFVLDEQNRAHYFIAVEPYGDAQGLREVWTIDARTGDYERFAPSDSLTGPRKATDFVRQAARTTDWDRFTPSEPIPTVIDGEMYWSVRVVPNDASGISYVAFVNAETTEVAEAETSAEISAFIAGETDVVDSTGPVGDDRTPTLIVKRIAPNGTVLETMEVYGNETVVVDDTGE